MGVTNDIKHCKNKFKEIIPVSVKIFKIIRYLYQSNWQGLFFFSFLVALKIIVCFSNKLSDLMKCIDPDAGKDWRQKKGMTEDEMVGCHHWHQLMPSTQWTWVWASSRSWWWTWKPGVLQSLGSQRVGRDWATEHQ